MNPELTIASIGHYCGRYSEGFLGEPQNSISNIVFIIGAAYAWHVSRSTGYQDAWAMLLFILAAAIGFGSFTFHTFPTETTLLIDLIPIQLFGLAYFGYIGSRYFEATNLSVAMALVAFFFIRQFWISFMPQGALGGGITHIPTLALVFLCSAYLLFKFRRLGILMFAAGVTYSAALYIRTWDLYLCSEFPFGLHWAWHVLTGLTVGILVYAVASSTPNKLVHVKPKYA